MVNKKQKEFKEKYGNFPTSKLVKEDDIVLADLENIFGEFLTKLQKTNLLRSHYILALSALVEQYKGFSLDNTYEKVRWG